MFCSASGKYAQGCIMHFQEIIQKLWVVEFLVSVILHFQRKVCTGRMHFQVILVQKLWAVEIYFCYSALFNGKHTQEISIMHFRGIVKKCEL